MAKRCQKPLRDPLLQVRGTTPSRSEGRWGLDSGEFHDGVSTPDLYDPRMTGQPIELDITLKNYRCFSDSLPATFTLGPGLTSFVGPNNAGKSAVLRFLYEFRELFQHLGNPRSLFPLLTQTNDPSASISSRVADPNELFNNSNDRDLRIEIRPVGVHPEGDFTVPEKIVVTFNRRTPLRWNAKCTIHGGAELQGGDYSTQETRIGGFGMLVEFGPILHALERAAGSIYVPAFRNVINVGEADNYFDISTGQRFVQAWHQAKSGDNRAANEATIRLMQEIERIFGFERLDINPTPDNRSLQVAIDGHSYGIGQVGSGLAHFILVLANVAVLRPSYLLIDEPELNLHPSLQIDFLTTVSSFANVGCLFSTHSVGLARSVSDRVFSVTRSEGISRIAMFEETANLTEFLGELNFSGYRDLGHSQILLVEGSTDVTAVMQLLRLYGKEHEVVLLSLGGSDGIRATPDFQLEELLRISSNICALIDSEKSGGEGALDPTRQKFQEVCSQKSIRCHVLERRALENYFPEHAVKAQLGEKFAALEPYESLKGRTHLGWSKSDNWRISRRLGRTDLEGTDLGEFLEAL